MSSAATRRRILIADDNNAVLDVVGKLLTQWGYEVISARDGAEAWKVLSGGYPPRMAILDWGMPRMDGLEVCRRVRTLPSPQTPYLIMLTGRDSQDSLIAGLEGGADEYLTKPVAIDELRARVQAGWRLVDRQQQLADEAGHMQDATTVREVFGEHSAGIQRTLQLCAATMTETLDLPDVPVFLRVAMRTCRGLCQDELGAGPDVDQVH